MPPKSKGGSKPKPAEPKKQDLVVPTKPQSVFEQSLETYALTRPYHFAAEQRGIHVFSPEERRGYINEQYLKPGETDTWSKKAQKEFWKQVNEASIPYRTLPRGKPTLEAWGKDKNGRNLGEYSVDEFNDYLYKTSQLGALQSLSETFRDTRFRASKGQINQTTGKTFELEDGAFEAEKARRKEIMDLRRELYSDKGNPYAIDPAWDDVVPIPQSEPEGALAAIAYPEDYAESMSYLRAVMALEEYTPRCLKLTEHIISMNPAHYTVWLYRFSIIQHLNIPILDELAWLNDVALENQKNYQIWHHRQLLTDYYYPTISDAPDEVKRFAKSERDFMMEMFADDAKNYHVWSYRQYLVRKLAMWDQGELESIEGMVKDDVRNNSAWSHRFFLVFSNPEYTTPDSHATEHDPAVPADIVDREIKYAEEMIKLAPQNQSPWNYLRGVLAKGGRKLASVREYAEGYVKDLGEATEQVQSSHALDQLADIYKEAGEKEKADLCLRRLGEKWDRIRQGYWEWKRKAL